jgi:hypothetical protein
MLQYYNSHTKILTIPSNFNDEFANIPTDTIEIKFVTGRTCIYELSIFNQEIKKNVLPNSLISLSFGCFFNKEIKENVLPNGLTYLQIGNCFNKIIKKNVLQKV